MLNACDSDTVQSGYTLLLFLDINNYIPYFQSLDFGFILPQFSRFTL